MTRQGEPTPTAPALLTAEDVSTTVVPGSALRSSQQRAWAGVEVVQRRHGTQALAVPPLGSHLLIIYQGRATVEMVAQIGEQQLERQLRPGALALVPARQLSAWQWRGTAPPTHDALHIYLDPARLGDAAETGAEPGELTGVFGAYDPQLAMLGGAFLDELTQRRVGEQLYVDALTTMLAVHLLRQYALECPLPLEAPRGTLAATELQRLTEYIEAMLEAHTLAQNGPGGEPFAGAAVGRGQIEHRHLAAARVCKQAGRTAEAAADVEHSFTRADRGTLYQGAGGLDAAGVKLVELGEDVEGAGGVAGIRLVQHSLQGGVEVAGGVMTSVLRQRLVHRWGSFALMMWQA